MCLFTLVFVFLLGCDDEHSTTLSRKYTGPPRSGAELYKSICLTCHQADGGGITGIYPPLAQSEWITGDVSVPYRIIEHGVMGEITVRGLKYSNVMAKQGYQLSDIEMMNILNHIRTHFGNAAPIVSLEQVTSLREQYKTRKKMWTASELRQ